ncbi:MAG: hypothetical protein ACXVW0_13170 [Nocardioides sp.]
MSSTKHVDLSWPNVVGGAVAAATAAALSTRLGVVGTVLGAALASVVSTVVTAGLAGWIEHLRGAAGRRDPLPYRNLLIGTAALALVAFAFHTGWQLVTSDLPHDAFAARFLSELGGASG